MNHLNCPIYHKNADLMAEMLVVLRRLRRGTKVCRTCTDRQTCPIQSELAEAVAQAAKEVLAELEAS